MNTTSFLNNFSDACEKKLSKVSYKLSELEIILAVLEAKLDSIPGLDGAAPATTPAPTVTSAAGSTDPIASAAPQHVPAANVAPPTANAEPTLVPPPPPAAPGLIAVKDHPDYKPFAKLLKVGIPLQAAKNKLMASG